MSPNKELHRIQQERIQRAEQERMRIRDILNQINQPGQDMSSLVSELFNGKLAVGDLDKGSVS